LRVFVAIDLDEKTKDSLWGLVEELMAYRADVRWVRREALHLTLKFLGEVAESKVSQIEEAVRDACAGAWAFEMAVRGTGVFASFSRPRVLWAGVPMTKALSGIQASVEDALARIGFDREKRDFHPHITLGRVKSQRGLQRLLQELRRYKELDFGKIYVTEVVLMESILSPDGARYKKVFSVELKK
jgi:2'-5' RNA ligase